MIASLMTSRLLPDARVTAQLSMSVSVHGGPKLHRSRSVSDRVRTFHVELESL